MTDTPRSLDWLKRLVSVDTTSRNSNVEIITMIADALREAGVEPQVFDDPKSEQTGVHKQGVVATIPASDGGTSGGVVLSGHTDVVPVDGQKWTSDPFTVTERDGKYYGRGVADMKSFIAVILTLLPELTKAQLKQPIHLAFSYDEEVACLGGDEIVKQLNDRGAKPVGAIIGEPSSMRVVKAHKSVNLYEVTFHGVAAHSSLTAQGVNAIEYAARLVTWWREVTDCWKSEGPWDDAYSLKWSTGGVNQFHGGTAVNIVPATATVLLEFRSIAEVDDDQVLAQTRAYCDQLRREMQAENPDADIDFQVQAIVPGLDTPADADIVTIAQDAGGLPCDDKVTYGTEGGQFSNGGIPAVVCGPGDIGQAHTPDEWLDPQQLLDCEQFVLKLAKNLSK